MDTNEITTNETEIEEYTSYAISFTNDQMEPVSFVEWKRIQENAKVEAEAYNRAMVEIGW